jgi:SAM-dependent methyltransferase
MLKKNSRKISIKNYFNELASSRDYWINKNYYFYLQDYNYMNFLIPNNSSILEIGCGTGNLLANLKPSYGLGIDLSNEMVSIAKKNHPNLNFLTGDIEERDLLSKINKTFDFVVLSDTVAYLEDIQVALENLSSVITNETRIIIATHSKFWEPFLYIAQLLRLKSPQTIQNNLTTDDISNFMTLSDMEIIKSEYRQFLPFNIFGISFLINNFIATLPFFNKFCLRNYIVARQKPIKRNSFFSASILIPCKNEKGNIENAIKRIPYVCSVMEIIFIEGGSSDGTYNEIERVIAKYKNLDIKVIRQKGKGKGDAVREGFDIAKGEVFFILDADLTVPPESLSKFFDVITTGKAEFINGSRLIYPMEKDAMRFLNFIANFMFSRIFTWLLNQRFTDTLCGTKVISRENYSKIKKNRSFFGDFDPFGDFDLIFGASKLNLKIIEIPINYKSRNYGETQISRFKHGFLLLKMVMFAFRKLKIV